MQALWESDIEARGDVWMFIVNSAGREDGLPELTAGLTLPVLQDTTDADVFEAYGASQWYVYVIDRQGVPRYIHYTLDMPGENERLLTEVDELRAEPRPAGRRR